MARFYTNENIPLPVVQALRILGHDVLTSLEAGNANQSISDQNVLAFACQENRILLTLNRKHFIQLHNLSDEHAGIIVCAFEPNFSELAKWISETVVESEPMAGKLQRINRINQA